MNIIDNYEEIDYLEEKVGETLFDFIMEEDNYTSDMGYALVSAIRLCVSDRDFQIANSVLSACCGYDFNSIIEEVKSRDNAGYSWNSL